VTGYFSELYYRTADIIAQSQPYATLGAGSARFFSER